MAETKPVPMMLVRSHEEVALDLMRFIAESTGYGRGASAAGFSAKGARSPEEQADALLELFERCRGVVSKNPSAG